MRHTLQTIAIWCILINLCSKSSADQFIFIPSPNIGVNQLALYHCSVDHIGVGIAWFVNGTASNDRSIKQLGIITIGAGSSNSSVTIPGYLQYNNTVVRCHGFGAIVNGSNYDNFNESTLRIQGKLAAVNNLICHVQSQYINCSWSPPFSLVSIPGYIINVTYGGEQITQNTTSSTTWQYCFSQFGNYTISVAGNNSAGEGEISTTSVVVPNDSIINYNATIKRLSNDTYSIDVIIQTIHSLLPISISINLTTNKETSFTVHGKADVIGSKFIGNFNIGKTGKQKLIVNLILNYDCKSLKNESLANTLSTFNVQNGSVTVINSTTGEVCFTCYFLEGSQSQGCYIEYNSLITDYYSGNITIVRTSVDTSTASKCVTGIYTSNYNVTFYDMDYNNNVYMEEYAVKLANQLVNGLPSITPSPSTVTIESPSLSTTLCVDNDNLRSKLLYPLTVIGCGIIGSSAVVAIIIIIIVIVIFILYQKYYKTNNTILIELSGEYQWDEKSPPSKEIEEGSL